MKPKHLVIVALLCLVALVAWKWQGRRSNPTADAAPAMVESGSGDSNDHAAPPQGDDSVCRQLLAESNRGEALAWLTDPSQARAVSHWDQQEAINLINDLYKAGALKVYVVDTQKIANTEVVDRLVVELPGEADARAKVFDRVGDFESEFDEDAPPDGGQRYLLLRMD